MLHLLQNRYDVVDAQNQNLFIRLSNELNELKYNHKKMDKNIKIKTTPFYLGTSNQNGSKDSDKLKQIKQRNQLLQKNITALKIEEERKRKESMPLFKQKKQEFKQKEAERQRLQQLSRKLKIALENEDMLELYQGKCRECQSLRKVNNQISQQIKTIIKEINQLSGSEENPNMFFMNLKV